MKIILKFRNFWYHLDDTTKEYIRVLFALLLSCLILGMIAGVVEAEAVTYTPYASVTPSQSQVAVLTDALSNEVAFSSRLPWVCLRVGEYDYRLLYNIRSDGSAMQLRYYASGSGYTLTWHLTRASVSDVDIVRNDFVVVGNGAGDLASESVRTIGHQKDISVLVVLLVVLALFFVFRVRKRSVKGVTL